MRLTEGLAVVAAMLGLSFSARADPSEPLGTRGTVAIAGDLNISTVHLIADGVASETSVSFAPAADYFVLRGLSVGGQVGIGALFWSGETAWTVSIEPRIGTCFGLTDRVSIWPRVGIDYTHFNDDGASPIAGSTPTPVTSITTLDIFVPVTFALAPHFFIGFGPRLTAQLDVEGGGTDYPQQTDIGAESVVGDWF